MDVFGTLQEIGDARRRRRQRFGVGVGHADLHSEAGEFPRGGETDAAGGAGDDRDASGGESGMMDMGESYGSQAMTRRASSHNFAGV